MSIWRCGVYNVFVSGADKGHIRFASRPKEEIVNS